MYVITNFFSSPLLKLSMDMVLLTIFIPDYHKIGKVLFSLAYFFQLNCIINFFDKEAIK